MASSWSFESLLQALLTILAMMLFQAVLDQHRSSRASQHRSSLLATINCLSAKLDQRQLNEKKYQLEVKSKLKRLQGDIDIMRSALRVRPTENELFLDLHQQLLREVRELRREIRSITAPLLPAAPSPVLPVAPPPPASPTSRAAASPLPPPLPPSAPVAASPPPTGVKSQPPMPPPDQSGILVLSDSEGDHDEGDDMFAPAGDYNLDEPWA